MLPDLHKKQVGTLAGPHRRAADPDLAGRAARVPPVPLDGVQEALAARLTVGKTRRCRSSPVLRNTWLTSGGAAARRRNPPSSLARRPVPISTASPLASQKLTLDRSMTSRLEAGRSKVRSRSRSSGALATSSTPASSAMMTQFSVRAETCRPGLAVAMEFTLGSPIRFGRGREAPVLAPAWRTLATPSAGWPGLGSNACPAPVRHGALSPARTDSTSPRVRSRLVGSGSARCLWIWYRLRRPSFCLTM